ncbi:MAG: class II aldolase/adducin family protein [Paracoccaceae bacterium]|nr:class II aldolase/adducin family protein [Paracoccaceae bacterium]
MTVHDIAEGQRPNAYTEWDARTDLAALHRLYVHFAWTDLIYTHLTARVPGEPGHYLIKPDQLMMDEVTASNLIKVDFDGNLVAGDAAPNQAGHLIHTAVLAARPEITFTAHTHSRSGAAVSCLAEGILPLSQHANMVLPTVCYHDYQDVTSAEDECAALARDLGDKFLMVMKNHGLLACGRSVGECFYWLYYLEMACKIQMDVLASGREPVLVSDAIVDGLYCESGMPENEPSGARAWSSMIRMLDRKESDFRE